MSKYHDDDSYATDPGSVSLHVEKFRRLEGLSGLTGLLWRWKGRMFEEMLDEHLTWAIREPLSYSPRIP